MATSVSCIGIFVVLFIFFLLYSFNYLLFDSLLLIELSTCIFDEVALAHFPLQGPLLRKVQVKCVE